MLLGALRGFRSPPQPHHPPQTPAFAAVSTAATTREIQFIYLSPIRSDLLPGLYFGLFFLNCTRLFSAVLAVVSRNCTSSHGTISAEKRDEQIEPCAGVWPLFISTGSCAHLAALISAPFISWVSALNRLPRPAAPSLCPRDIWILKRPQCPKNLHKASLGQHSHDASGVLDPSPCSCPCFLGFFESCCLQIKTNPALGN